MAPAHGLRKSPSILSLTTFAHRTSHPSPISSNPATRYETDNTVKRTDGTCKRRGYDHDRVSGEPPSRPISRLGYSTAHSLNHPGSCEVDIDENTNENLPVKESATRSLTVRWTRSRVQRINLRVDDESGEDDEDKNTPCLTLNEEEQDSDMGKTFSPKQLGDDDVEMDLEDTSISDDSISSSDSEYSDSGSEEPLVLTRACTPEPEPESCPEPPEEEAPSPPQQQNVLDYRLKYSCLPSPLSLLDDGDDCMAGSSQQNNDSDVPPKQNITLLRHLYAHRGYSRHGLQHTRTFWANKREKWAEGISPAYMPDTQDNLDEDCNGTQESLDTEMETSPPPWQQPQPYCLKIHPRTGDMSSLRDPWGTHIDMCFAGMPMWTMHKMLWMFAIHAAVADANAAHEHEQMRTKTSPTEELEEVGMESESTGSTDASDRTLVEDMYVGEVQLTRCKTEEMMSVEEREKWEMDDIMMEEVELNCEVEEGSGPSCSSPPPEDARKCQPKWALTANARWLLLLDLVHHQYLRPIIPLPTARPLPRFFVGDDDDGWLDERGQRISVCEDEEEDYGVLVTNTMFGGGGGSL